MKSGSFVQKKRSNQDLKFSHILLFFLIENKSMIKKNVTSNDKYESIITFCFTKLICKYFE